MPVEEQQQQLPAAGCHENVISIQLLSEEWTSVMQNNVTILHKKAVGGDNRCSSLQVDCTVEDWKTLCVGVPG